MTLPSLKLRALARFPVAVQGGGGIAVSKANGVWTVEPDFSQLAEIPGSSIADPSSKQLWIFDPLTEIYNLLSLDGLADVMGASLPDMMSDLLGDAFGTNTNQFITYNGSAWTARALVGDDLPTPTALDLGGVFALPVSSNDVLSGIGTDGVPTRATVTGTGHVVRAASPTLTGSVSVTGNIAGTAQNAHALAVGRLGATTPALQVDSSVASSITGLSVAAQAAGNGVWLNAIGEINVPILINAAGNGGVYFQTSATGPLGFYQSAFFNFDTDPTLTFGTTGNTKGTLASRGSGGFEFKEAGGNILAAISPTAASGQVNYPRLRPNSAGGGVILDAQGTDANINTSVIAKGAGAVLFSTGGGSIQAQVQHTASANRSITLTGSNGGNPTIGTTAGNLAITPAVVGAASLTAHAGTGIPAGGTAGAGLLVSSTANFGVFFGSGAPTLSAAKGSLYLRSDGSGTSNRAYINTDGGTTWTALTTAA